MVKTAIIKIRNQKANKVIDWKQNMSMKLSEKYW